MNHSVAKMRIQDSRNVCYINQKYLCKSFDRKLMIGSEPVGYLWASSCIRTRKSSQLDEQEVKRFVHVHSKNKTHCWPWWPTSSSSFRALFQRCVSFFTNWQNLSEAGGVSERSSPPVDTAFQNWTSLLPTTTETQIRNTSESLCKADSAGHNPQPH